MEDKYDSDEEEEDAAEKCEQCLALKAEAEAAAAA